MLAVPHLCLLATGDWKKSLCGGEEGSIWQQQPSAEDMGANAS